MSINGRLKTKVMSTAEDTALPGLDSVHEVQNYLSVQLLSRTGTHILRDAAVNIYFLRRTALAIQSFAVRELSSHGPWVMTKCQAAWKLQALLTVTLWRTKLLPSRECSPSAATPSGSHPPQGLWCHKCHMKSFVQRASAHLKRPHLRNLPCQHQHARIPGRKNTCSHLAVNPTCICKQTIPSLTQKVIKDWHTTAMTKKAHSACLYHSTSTSRRRLTKKNTEKQQIKQRVDQTSTRNRFRIKNIFDVAWYHPSEIVHLQVSLSLKIQQKIPDSPRFLDLSQIQAWDYTLSDSSIALQLDPKKCHTCASQSAACLAQRRNSPQSPRRTKIITFVFACYSTQIESLKETSTLINTFPFLEYISEKKDKKKMYVYCFISKWSQVCSI